MQRLRVSESSGRGSATRSSPSPSCACSWSPSATPDPALRSGSSGGRRAPLVSPQWSRLDAVDEGRPAGLRSVFGRAAVARRGPPAFVWRELRSRRVPRAVIGAGLSRARTAASPWWRPGSRGPRSSGHRCRRGRRPVDLDDVLLPGGLRREPRAIPDHSTPFVVIGAMLLFVGWFGFNPGSELAADAGLIYAHAALARRRPSSPRARTGLPDSPVPSSIGSAGASPRSTSRSARSERVASCCRPDREQALRGKRSWEGSRGGS